MASSLKSCLGELTNPTTGLSPPNSLLYEYFRRRVNSRHGIDFRIPVSTSRQQDHSQGNFRLEIGPSEFYFLYDMNKTPRKSTHSPLWPSKDKNMAPKQTAQSTPPKQATDIKQSDAFQTPPPSIAVDIRIPPSKSVASTTVPVKQESSARGLSIDVELERREIREIMNDIRSYAELIISPARNQTTTPQTEKVGRKRREGGLPLPIKSFSTRKSMVDVGLESLFQAPVPGIKIMQATPFRAPKETIIDSSRLGVERKIIPASPFRKERDEVEDAFAHDPNGTDVLTPSSRQRRCPVHLKMQSSILTTPKHSTVTGSRNFSYDNSSSKGTSSATRAIMLEDLGDMKNSIRKMIGAKHGLISKEPEDADGSEASIRLTYRNPILSQSVKKESRDTESAVRRRKFTLQNDVPNNHQTPLQYQSPLHSITVPRAARRTIFDVTKTPVSPPAIHLSYKSGNGVHGPAQSVTALRLSHDLIKRLSIPISASKIDKKSQITRRSPLSEAVRNMKDNKNEVPQIASAEHISAFIQKLHSEERDGIAGQNSTSTTPPGTPPPAVRKTPWRNNTFDKPTLVSREDTQAKPNLGLVEARVRPLPSTPVNKSKAMDRDEAATRTPSKEIESSLDRAIDRQIVLDMKKGHEFTPGGNRISDLLKRRKEWLGLEGYEADE